MIAEHTRRNFAAAESADRDQNSESNLLWCEGNIDLLGSLMASVVGTRRASPEGIRRAQKLTAILVDQGFTVVSGMAAGIDAAAHIQALDLDGKTVAVMGTPVEGCYPAEHLPLKTRIAERGLIVSQFPPGSPVLRSNFPQRNILMAALSAITFVVEADADSGTRHQVKAAIQMGRRVAFLTSLVDQNIPWVVEALRSGAGNIVDTPETLIMLLHAVRVAEPQHGFVPSCLSATIRVADASQQQCHEIVAYWSSLITINARGSARVIGRAVAPPQSAQANTKLPAQKKHDDVRISVTAPYRVASLCKRLWNSFALLVRRRGE